MESRFNPCPQVVNSIPSPCLNNNCLGNSKKVNNMYAAMNVSMIVSGRAKVIYRERLYSNQLDELRREAEKAMDKFGEANPKIDVANVEIKINFWL